MLEKKNLIFLFEKCGSAVPAMPISFECGINIDRSAPETHATWCVTTVYWFGALCAKSHYTSSQSIRYIQYVYTYMIYMYIYI